MGISFAAWYRNTGKKYLLLTLWICGCAALFWRTYCYYKYDPGFYYVHQMLGPWLCISRGSAAVLNLNCGLVLLPTCRFLLTALRKLHSRISFESMRTLLNSCKGFHIACAFVICVNSGVHVVAHIFNARNFSIYYNTAIPSVNGAHSPHEDPMIVVLTTVPGVTGTLMLLLLVMVVTSSVRYMREINYDLFWYTHRLIAVFYILLMIHALRGPIRKQINITKHTPGCKSSFQNASSIPEPYPEPEAEYSFVSYTCAEEPHFDRIGCQSWLWIGIPLFLYVIDGACRIKQKETSILVTNIVQHDPDIVEICMRTDIRKPSPGQYVLVQCPRISVFEWHPYSLTKCPTKGSPDLSIHIRSHGDWSEKLGDHIREILQVDGEGDEYSTKEIHNRLKLRIDGPFGGPLDKVLKCGISLCIGGGIGITPFISVLNHLRCSNLEKRKLKRMYLIWICRTVVELTCFATTITSTYKYLWNENLPDLFDVQFYCTRLEDQVERTLPAEYEGFINNRLQAGRPSWPSVFRTISESHRRENVHVFACGPRGLIQEVEDNCLQTVKHRTKFILHKESF